MPWSDSPPSEGPLLAERYRLVSRIGEGGMAGVYRAWDDRLRVWRAAKVLLPEFARKRKLRKRFEREAHTMARLEHANLVRVVDVGNSGSLPFIVMELVPCGTLMQWVEQHGPMPPAMATRAMLEVAEGLAEVHRNGVIHRDIKPHNVLINEQGTCKITDFGIAQEAEEGLTRAGSVMGTMGYMAPEQRNDASGVDQRADVYGFGATLWKLVTGRPLSDLFMYTEDPSIMEGIDEGLAEVLMACLSYSRRDRPAEMSEVIDALQAVIETLPPDPASTPQLPLLGQVESVEAEASTFAEIAPAFTLSEMPSEEADASMVDAPLVDAGPRSMPGLPYGLPQRMENPPEEQPSWLAEDDPTTDELAAPFEIRPEGGYIREESEDEPSPVTRSDEASVSYEAPTYLDEPEDSDAEPAPPTPVPPSRPEPEAPAVDPAMLFRTILVGVVVTVVVVSGMLYWSYTTVATAASMSKKESARFYATLNDERNVATELVHFDRAAASLEGHYLDYLDHPREPERWEKAMTFLDELDVYGEALDNQDGPNVKTVKGRISRLRNARQAVVAARRHYLSASSSFPGILTSAIGISPSPDFDASSLEQP